MLKLQDLFHCFLRKAKHRKQVNKKEQPKFDGFGKISFHNRVYIQQSFLRTVMKKSCLVPSLALTVAFVEPTYKPFKVKVMLFSVVRVAIELSSTVQVKVIFSPFLK